MAKTYAKTATTLHNSKIDDNDLNQQEKSCSDNGSVPPLHTRYSEKKISAGSLLDDLRQHVLHGEYATKKTTCCGGCITNLICPECGKAEGWAYAERPFVIVCNRQNKCGARTRTLPLFNLCAKIETHYPAQEGDPHRPARAYLESRGIPTEIINQLIFEYHPKTRKNCGGGIMFPVGKDEQGKTLYNGRLFNPPAGEGKTHNIGPVSGHYWKMPGMDYDPDAPTYVTEGIIDALSLIVMGKQAIAVLGAGYDPEKFDLSSFGNLVFAFDNDEAGGRFTRKWLNHMRDLPPEANPPAEVSAIMPINGDWNDLLCNVDGPEKAAERFDEQLDRYRFQANLMLAETALQYATIYKNETGFAPGLFAFNGRYYWSWLAEDKETGETVVSVERVANFTVEVEHYQRSDADEELPVFFYRLQVKPEKGRTVFVTATGNDLKSADAMTGFFLRHGKVFWKGKAEATKAFIEMIVSSKAPIIRQADYTGYDHKSDWYVVRDLAIDQRGRVVLPDTNGFFRVRNGEYLRPALVETIKPGNCDVVKLYWLLVGAWGNNAAVALAFLVASLFVNAIKPIIKFFPFLSLFGDPQTGKSRLLMILNALQCLDEEGVPMSGANTKKGELRTLAQVSGIMKGLIEGNDPMKARFDFESILPLYNHGNPLQVRAQTTNDNRIHKMPFHGTIAFVQNVEPFRSRAAKERVISLKFSTDELNEQSKAAFDELVSIPLAELAGFFPATMENRILIQLTWQAQFADAKAHLKSAIPDNRINENHALILAFHRLLCQCFSIKHDLLPFIAEIGKVKMVSCQQRSLTAADYFFDALNELPDDITGVGEFLDYKGQKTNFMEIRGKELFLNWPGAEKAIRAAGIPLDFPERLGNSLQQHPAFLRGGVSHRFKGNREKVIRAMVFDLQKF